MIRFAIRLNGSRDSCLSIRQAIIGYKGVERGTSLGRGLYVRSGVVDVDEAKVPATTEVCVISGKFLPLCENNSDEFTICPHPFLLVKADKAWSGGVNSVISAHLYLRKSRGGLRGI